MSKRNGTSNNYIAALIDIDEPIRIPRNGTAVKFIYELGNPPLISFRDLEFFLTESEADRGVNPITDLSTVPTWSIHPDTPSTDTSIAVHNGYVLFDIPINPIYKKFYGRIVASAFYNFALEVDCPKISWQKSSVTGGKWQKSSVTGGKWRPSSVVSGGWRPS